MCTCVRLLSFLSTMHLLADGSANLGPRCVCVCVYILGGTRGQNLPGAHCQVFRSLVLCLPLNPPTHTHTHTHTWWSNLPSHDFHYVRDRISLLIRSSGTDPVFRRYCRDDIALITGITELIQQSVTVFVHSRRSIAQHDRTPSRHNALPSSGRTSVPPGLALHSKHCT